MCVLLIFESIEEIGKPEGGASGFHGYRLPGTVTSNIGKLPSDGYTLVGKFYVAYKESLNKFTNDSVYRVLLQYVLFLFVCLAIFFTVIYSLKVHYRAKLLDELEKIRTEKEPARVYYVEADSGAQRVVPSPLSNPITDQELYNPLGPPHIDEARRAAI
ncbi:unnamed protein product [Angiostrongylus costaricensis]|uniref:Movement protein n=1 Tax=Angiostrongylus costaricensis TaxID=334426 RepID=A0A0R3PBS9_ANGCS|nr:unnamed protein product [Angiostrongylus costaricensis]